MLENSDQAIAKANELQGENAHGGPYIAAHEIEQSPLSQKVWFLEKERPMLGGSTPCIAADGVRFGIPVRPDNPPTVMVDQYNKAKNFQS